MSITPLDRVIICYYNIFMITNRQAQILAAIVKEYSQSGDPVGSLELEKKYNFAVSPATIRNEMQVLEDEGFITQPHTSAGRVPTDTGYRYFVNKLMKHMEMSAAEQQRLRSELGKLQKQYVELGRGLAKLLSSESRGAAFALLPENVATAGLSNMIDEHTSQAEVKEMASFMDRLEENCQALIKKDIREVETFIGREMPMPIMKDFSLVVTKVKLPAGKDGIIGVVGPKRMKYARNISLLEYISKLLASGLGAVIIFNF